MGVSPPERVEQKFFVTPDRMILALALVRRTCRRDGAYPEEQINSLYFDTPELDEHQNSLAGEFAKSKVRIRWYGEQHDPHESAGPAAQTSSAVPGVSVWLELKQRRGLASTKQRCAIDVAAGMLEPQALSRGIVPVGMLVCAMAGFGFFSAKPLRPVIAISYWRLRFVEPRTGFRVAFDSQVRSTVIMPGIGCGERGLELPGVVIEVKGPSAELPACLGQLRDLGSSWTRFSKYSSSLDAHAGDLGSVYRLWPSGTMHAGASPGTRTSSREGATCGRN